MATQTDSNGTQEDERGRELAEKSTHLDQRGAKPLDPSEQAKLDQTEAGLQNGDSASEPHYADRSGAGGGSGLPSGGGGGRLGNTMKGIGGFAGRNRKKLLFGGGGIAAIGGLLVVLFLGLIPLKLIHIREVMDQYFGARSSHMNEQRVGKIWVAIADKDGSVRLDKASGHPLRDHIYNVNSQKIVDDMKLRGLNVDLDPTTHHIRLDGQELDGKLADRRSVIRQQLNEAYPEDGYIRRSVRATHVFHIFGIKRTFFENTKEKVSDWEQEIKQKIRERLFGTAPDKVAAAANKSGDEKTDSDTSKAVKDLNESLGDESETLRQGALDDPSKAIQEVDTNISPDDLAKAGATDSVKGALNATAALTQVCNIKNLMTEVKTAAKIYRERSLARYAGTILVAADQLKTGDQVNGNEVNALMNGLSGFEQSGGWQIASGANPKAPVTTAAKYSLNLTQQGGGAAFFVNLSNDLNAIPGGGTTCKVATNIFFQIGSTLLTVAGDLFTGGGLSIVSIGASTSVSLAVGATEQILKPMAIQMLAGMTVTGDEPAKDKGDAIFGGADIIYNDIARVNGGRKLTAKEVSTLNRTIASEQTVDNAHQSLAYRLFDLDNPSSMTARLAFAMPSSFSDLATSITNFTASINPFNLTHMLTQSNNGLLSIFAPRASAEDSSTVDPVGVDQIGLTDDELNAPDVNDPVANENYILDDPQRKQQYEKFTQDCLNSQDVDDSDKDECDATDDLTNRFRIYRVDLGLAGGIDFMSGSTPTPPDDDGIGDGTN